MISPYPAINTELSSKEKLLWSGQPQKGIKFGTFDIFLIPFSILWISGPIGMLLSGSTNTQNFPFVLFPSIFLVIGGYLLFGRFFQDSWRRSKTYYGLTDKRVILFSKSGIKSIPLTEATEMHFKGHRNNRSSIQFGASASMFSMSHSQAFKMWSGAPMAPTFESIKDGEKVYKLIKEQIGI